MVDIPGRLLLLFFVGEASREGEKKLWGTYFQTLQTG